MSTIEQTRSQTDRRNAGREAAHRDSDHRSNGDVAMTVAELPAAWERLNRNAAERNARRTRHAARRAISSLRTAGAIAHVGNQTLFGTARLAAARTAKLATRRSDQQRRAVPEPRRAATVGAPLFNLPAHDDMAGLPERADARQLQASTKADLYDRARRLGIEGRSSMNKSQLVSALANV